jgi:hypothetical protein
MLHLSLRAAFIAMGASAAMKIRMVLEQAISAYS